MRSCVRRACVRRACVRTHAGKRNINAFQLAMLTYFFTCGGPFGIEPSVGAAGPVITLIALFFVPILWSLPQGILINL